MSTLSINTNPSSFIALETLNDTTTKLTHTENSVSTGKKVAIAGDNPASFGIDQEIGGEVAGQKAVNDGLTYASSVINTSTSAANSIIGVLKNIRNTVTAAGDVVGEKGAESDLDHQITGYLNQIDTISRSATSNGINLLAGVTSNGYDITGTKLSYVTDYEGNTNHVLDAFTLLNPIIRQQSFMGYYTSTGGCFDEPEPKLSDYIEPWSPPTPPSDPQKITSDEALEEANEDFNTNLENARNAAASGDVERAGVALKNFPLNPSAQEKADYIHNDASNILQENASDRSDYQKRKHDWDENSTSIINQARAQYNSDKDAEESDFSADHASWSAAKNRNAVYKRHHGGHCPPIKRVWHYVGPQTLSFALGLTNQNQANTPVTKNIFSKYLEGDYHGEHYDFHTHQLITFNASPGDSLKHGYWLNRFINNVDTAIKGMQYITAKLGDNAQTIGKLISFSTKLGDNLQDAQGSLVDADMSKESARLTSLQTKQQLSIKSLTIANGQSQNIISLFQ